MLSVVVARRDQSNIPALRLGWSLQHPADRFRYLNIQSTSLSNLKDVVRYFDCEPTSCLDNDSDRDKLLPQTVLILSLSLYRAINPKVSVCVKWGH